MKPFILVLQKYAFLLYSPSIARMGYLWRIAVLRHLAVLQNVQKFSILSINNNNIKNNYDNNLDKVMSILDLIFAPDTYKFNKISAYLNNNFSNNSKIINEMLVDFNINTRDKDGKNLLHLFAHREEFCKIALERGIDVNARDKLGNTPIFYATIFTQLLFIEHGADLNVRNNEGHSVLHKKSRDYDNSRVKHLIQAGAAIDYNEYYRYELLQIAVLFRDKDKMKELIAEQPAFLYTTCRTEWHPRNRMFFTPIFVAAHNGFYDEFQLLVDAIGNNMEHLEIRRIITDILTSWKYSKNEGKVAILRSIVDLFPQIIIESGKNDTGEYIIHECNSDAKFFEMFLEIGLDIHCKTDLSYGERSGGYQTKRLLSDAEPLLYFTAYTADITIYKLLFEHGADPDLKNCYGVTAFMGLCRLLLIRSNDNLQKIKDLIQLFLDNGANVYTRDNDGKTAIDYMMHNDLLNSDQKATIVKMIYEKEKFFILEPKANEFVYNLLRNVRNN